mgnify:CR=1 FL=1
MKRGMLIAISILLLLNSFFSETYAAPLKKTIKKVFRGKEKSDTKTSEEQKIRIFRQRR